MSRHSHKWEIETTVFRYSSRVFSVYWVCTQGRCTGTKTVELKPLRKPSKDARTDEEVCERKADRIERMHYQTIHEQCTSPGVIEAATEGMDADGRRSIMSILGLDS